MKKIMALKRVIVLTLVLSMMVTLLSACASSTGSGRLDGLIASLEAQNAQNESAAKPTLPAGPGETAGNAENPETGNAAELPTMVPEAANMVARVLNNMERLKRPAIMSGAALKLAIDESPSVPEYRIAAGLSNVEYIDRENFTPAQLKTLEDYGFVVMPSYKREFFETYESNRYVFFPNFVTVDSMMHMYHIYFAYLMKKTERDFLFYKLEELGERMLALSKEQYDQLLGTEWESAAARNVGFFAVGASLLREGQDVPDYIRDQVNTEISLIEAAEQMTSSPLTGESEDYTQYKPRGYYAGSEELEKYFRAMMWYGRMNFRQSDEDLDRSAFLMTLAMDDAQAFDAWEKIYVITSFFAGTSDDNGYYEYKPLIDAVFEDGAYIDELPGEKEKWELFHEASAQLPPPAINSVPTEDTGAEESTMELNAGFRFMGQRFSIDAAIFQQLIYRQVGNADDTDKRMLPDVLDVPAAFGSEEALSILEEQGDTSYAKYMDHMNELRTSIENAGDDQWNVSLYSSWLNTLRPLTVEKGEGYPFFMQNQAWTRHNLETFAGSYTELKHDTVLYSKQVMAEMGGGGMIPEYDDRGYVEPEPEIYYRLSVLTQKTREGLAGYDMLYAEDEENLRLFEELADQLKTISLKELQDEVLTDSEYELIRTYGGNLEHLWIEAMKEEAGTDRPRTKEFPAAVITDIATDPNGSVLEVGSGIPSEIFVVVPVDGRLVLASGTVYSFYQFEWPMNNRLTDSQWRQMLGIEVTSDGRYEGSLEDEGIYSPEWTELYRTED